MRQSAFTDLRPANDNPMMPQAIGDLFDVPPSIGIDFGSGDQTSIVIMDTARTVDIIDESDPRFLRFLSMAVAP